MKTPRPFLFLILVSFFTSSAFAIGKPIVSRNAPPAPVYAVQQPVNNPTPQQQLDARYRDTGIPVASVPGHKPKPAPAMIQR